MTPGTADDPHPATVANRSYYSTHFLAAAQDAARAATEYEAAVDHVSNRFSLRHRGFVLAGVIESVAFLEAAINEVLQDAADDHLTEKLDGVDPVVRRCWAALWRALDEGMTGRGLDRFQAALIAGECEPYDRAAEPWQSAPLSVRVR